MKLQENTMHSVRNSCRYTLFDKIYLIYIFLYANIFISPMLAILPFSLWKLLTCIAFFLLFVSYTKGYYVNKLYVLLFIFTVIMSSITAIYYQDINPVTNNMAFLLVLVLFVFFNEKYINPFIDYSTIFICLVIIGAYIGFIYAFVGGSPQFQYIGPEGRLHYFYLTTSVPANAVVGRFIRPGGIYDEPGALSGFICQICLLRVLFKKNDKLTFLIMIAGLITFSLFHLIIVLCFFAYYLIEYRRKKDAIIFISFITILILGSVIVFNDAVNYFLFSRLRLNPETGRLAGDTRTHMMLSTLELLNSRTFFWGIGKDVYYNPINYIKLNDNPLTLLVKYGVFVKWYYYVFIIIIFIIGLIKYKYIPIYIAICLLFLPRTFPHIISYSFYFVLFFYSVLSKLKKSDMLIDISSYSYKI